MVSCRCQCVFYCSQECMQKDFEDRHWNLCSNNATILGNMPLSNLMQIVADRKAANESTTMKESMAGSYTEVQGGKTPKAAAPAKKKYKKKKKKSGAKTTDSGPASASQNDSTKPQTTLEGSNGEPRITLEGAKHEHPTQNIA